MASTAPPRTMARLLARTWLAELLFVGGPFAEGIGNGNSISNNNNGRRRPPPHHPAAMTAEAASERRSDGLPSNSDCGDSRRKSFYERNGLEPPPLLSRTDRLRRTQELPAASELEKDIRMEFVIEEAKLGLDPATRIRRDLIRLGKRYDKNAYPWEYAWHGQEEGSRTGVPVEFSINFHKVFMVDIINPVLDIIAWTRIEWVDPRLTWKPEEYGNLTKTWFWIGEGGAGGETSEIWTPDIELWNLEHGLRESFEDGYATVSHDGSVYWSRPGHLRPACKFSGLDTFPFDRLSCTMEFGSWAHSGKYMRLVKGGGGSGYSVGGSETAGESYEEYSFAEEDPVQCKTHLYPPYPTSPEEDWPVLLYNVTIRRSWQPYARGYILTQVILNIVGFSAFWLPPSCGERMGLTITAMLAAVAEEIAVAEKLPAAAQYTWFQKFSLLSMMFAFVSLLECVAVLYFHYKTSENLIPSWFTQLRKWYVFKHLMGSFGKNVNAKDEDSISENDARKMASPDDASSCDEEEKKDKIDMTVSHMCTVNFPKEQGRAFELNEKSPNDESQSSLETSDRDFGLITTGSKSFQDSSISNLSFNGDTSNDKLNKWRTGGQVTYSEGGNREEPGEQGRELPPPLIHPSLSPAQPSARRASMQQFKESLIFMESRSIRAPRDGDDFNGKEEMQHNQHWKHIAARIDDVARYFIPLAFFIALSIVLSEIS